MIQIKDLKNTVFVILVNPVFPVFKIEVDLLLVN